MVASIRLTCFGSNTDPLGNGWFFKLHIKDTDMAEFDQLMDEPEYTKFTAAN